MELSQFGEKLTSQSGILQLMDDLGKAMAHAPLGVQGFTETQKMRMLGGGNPAHIPEMEQIWRRRMQDILQNKDEYERMLGNYTAPQGDGEFIKAVAKFLKKRFGWNISQKNIAVLNGSQTAFFFLLNMFAGRYPDGSFKKILFPLVPEYIGYVDQGMDKDCFVGVKPHIAYLSEHTFKYRINFDEIKITEEIGGICISRPTNPTGNVVTDAEIQQLHLLAKENNIPLLIDNAYGSPFPNVIYTGAEPIWDEQVVFVFSLSKVGLPSTRTASVVANEEVITWLSSINAIVSLSTGTIGQHLVMPLIQNGELANMSETIIKPYYQTKAEDSIGFFQKIADQSLPYYLHKAEGAFFLWLWCKDFPITSQELYERLKNRGVLVVPGHYFFPGLQKPWKHTTECIRITYSQDEKDVKEGLKIIAEEIKKVYC